MHHEPKGRPTFRLVTQITSTAIAASTPATPWRRAWRASCRRAGGTSRKTAIEIWLTIDRRRRRVLQHPAVGPNDAAPHLQASACRPRCGRRWRRPWRRLAAAAWPGGARPHVQQDHPGGGAGASHGRRQGDKGAERRQGDKETGNSPCLVQLWGGDREANAVGGGPQPGRLGPVLLARWDIARCR